MAVAEVLEGSGIVRPEADGVAVGLLAHDDVRACDRQVPGACHVRLLGCPNSASNGGPGGRPRSEPGGPRESIANRPRCGRRPPGPAPHPVSAIALANAATAPPSADSVTRP